MSIIIVITSVCFIVGVPNGKLPKKKKKSDEMAAVCFSFFFFFFSFFLSFLLLSGCLASVNSSPSFVDVFFFFLFLTTSFQFFPVGDVLVHC